MKRTRNDDVCDPRKRARELGIDINAIMYHKELTDVPSSIKNHYDKIQVLGETKYVDYAESEEEPWRSSIKQKALRVTEMAAKCREKLQNEAGWRDALESKILERLDVEVACKNCRGRLWRSEIEVEDDSSITRVISLKERQRKRKACTCSPKQRKDEYSLLDPGINNLFFSRLDTGCHKPGASACERKEDSPKRPDRIHGLCRTENIDTLLRSLYTHSDRLSSNKTVEEIIDVSLQPHGGKSALLFPFLILEAKSEISAASFGKAERQTSSSIQRALKLQLDLLQTLGNTAEVPRNPMVWFLAYRGEDWRVYGGHMEQKEEGSKCSINYIWGGSLTGVNGSLQLLLIVDYIVDWARDSFRPNILRQLKSLASVLFDDRASIDPDIMSLNGLDGVIDNFLVEDSDDSTSEELGSPPQLLLTDQSSDEDPFEQQFTTTHGLVKDARRINSRLRGLLITRDNIQTLFQTFKTPKQVEKFARETLVLLKRQGVVVNGETLGVIEERWNGHPQGQPACSDGALIHVQFHISFYVNSVWEIVRELTYLAVEDAALDLLVERAAYKRHGPMSNAECRKISLITAFENVCDRSVLDDLMSAVCRRTYVLGFEEPSTVIIAHADCVTEERQEAKPVFQQAMDTKTEKPGLLMQGVVRKVFDTIQAQTENHAMAGHQLLEPFLRASTNTSMEEKELRQPGDCLLEDQKTFLVYSDVPSTRHLPDLARRRYCLYIIDDQQVGLSEYFIASALQSTLHQQSVYTTVRRSRAPGPGNKNWQDNREDFSQPYNRPKDGQPLMAEAKFRSEVCDWIRALAYPVSDESQHLDHPLASWSLSASARA